MIGANDEFRRALSQVRRGSDDALWEIIETYEPHIQRVVRRRLGTQLRSKYDTMDFVQMVWKSIFEDPQQFQRFDVPEQLIAFLAKMAQNKIDTEYRRRLGTQKHNINREAPWEEPDNQSPRACETPSQIAIARELWDELIRDLPPKHREVVRMRLEGATFTEIAERLEMHERTARKVIKNLMAAAHPGRVRS